MSRSKVIVYEELVYELDDERDGMRLVSASADGKHYALVISDASKEETLHIYPNPAKQVLHAKWNGVEIRQVELRLLNALGQVALKRNMAVLLPEQSIQIQLAAYPPGGYVVQILHSGGIISRKILIE